MPKVCNFLAKFFHILKIKNKTQTSVLSKTANESFPIIQAAASSGKNRSSLSFSHKPYRQATNTSTKSDEFCSPLGNLLRICFSFAPSSQQQAGVTCSFLQEHTAPHRQISHCCHHGSHSLLAHKCLKDALLLVACATDNVWANLALTCKLLVKYQLSM